ncbi:MAG: hypothetical protein EI684_18660 [Candidatus Viridilinea halotolerans]|uniref:FtsK domain-containing protein n=1 Tax=Candidatus Viridilinea halotolerans TaxID=2491704 RepID=A0A426TTA3_9CHLR|nr:MAG: hypothetical protein EI684_18660 [Candidatus Viridilinea halotolerans]
MSTQSFNRPPRVRPHWHAEEVDLPEPPDPPDLPRTDWLTMMIPLMGAGIFAGTASINGTNPLFVAIPMGSMALMTLGAGLLNQRAAHQRATTNHAARKDFFEDHLVAGRNRLRRLYEQERAARGFIWPHPSELLLLAGATTSAATPEARLWERRPIDDDFLDLRVGAGNRPAASQARVTPPRPGGTVDQRLFTCAEEYATLRQVPVSVPLGRLGSLGLAGPRGPTTALVRALLWQAAVLHAPAELRIAALCEPTLAAEWEWLRWLPHTIPLSNDVAPGARMLAGNPHEAARLASDLLDQLSRRRERAAGASSPPLILPRLLLLVDGSALAQSYPAIAEVLRHGAPLGLTALLVAPTWPQLPEDCGAMLELEEQGARWVERGAQWPRERFTPDEADLALSDRLARRLAGLRLVESGGTQAIPRRVRLFDLLGITGADDLLPPRAWSQEWPKAWAPAPFGAAAENEPACLDLNEGRHGPHGIIAGATGAGKSVLLQSIIAALAATHPPERLQLLLIDFKGGAALMMFAPLPHTAGLVTDLEGRLAERAMTAIKSELRRRKGLLHDLATEHTCKIEHIADYRALAARAHLPPLPNLLIVVDEFDELARGNPEFVAELIRVVKQGRSLGVHLLVATQQPARAVSDEIRSQLSFFIALRLGDAEDSRTMLLKPDAAFLPTDLPGRAYMRASGEVRLLQVAQVTATYRPNEAQGPQVSFLRDGREERVGPEVVSTTSADEASDLDVLIHSLCTADRLRGPAFPNWAPARIWQPPLPTRLALGVVMFQENRRTEEQENRRTGEQRNRGTEEQRNRRTGEQENRGTGEQRNRGTEEQENRRAGEQISASPPPTSSPPASAPPASAPPASAPPASSSLRQAIGLLDLPQESRQEPLVVDFANGHLVVVGAPGSGKTTLLRSLVLGLAASHAPRDFWCYLVDAGGQGLGSLAGLPHVGAHIQAREAERVRRLLRWLEATLRERQELLRAADAPDLASYRAQTGLAMPALLLVIDKLAVLREELRDGSGDDALNEQLVRLLRMGSASGIYIALSGERANDLGYKLMALIETRIALRQPELYDYNELLGVRVSAQIPPTLAGRALIAHPDYGALDVQLALPDLSPSSLTGDAGGSALDGDLTQILRTAVVQVASQWATQRHPADPTPPPIELLPERIRRSELDAKGKAVPTATNGVAAPWGRESLGLDLAWLQLDNDTPHALVVGPRRSGKSNALLAAALGLAESSQPSEVAFYIIDSPRGGLRTLANLAHTAHYANDDTSASVLACALSAARTSAQATRRIILLDDYILCRERMRSQLAQNYGGPPNLLDSLLEIVQLGGQHGEHLLLAAGMSYPDDALLKALDACRAGLLLWPGRYDPGTRLLGVTLPLAEQRDTEQPPGRALLVREDQRQIVQVAFSG